MRITTAATIILSLILIFELAILTQRTSSFPVPNSETVPVPVITNPVSAIIESQTPSPKPTDYPKPDYTPAKMREFNTMQKGDLILALDPPSYVTPGNAWVKWQASQLYVAADGRIKYKYEKTPWVRNIDGTVYSWSDRPYYNNYSFQIYGSSVDKNNIPWMMPEYYITHGGRGVCTAWANTVTSLMLSGEMSAYQDSGELKKQVIPAKTVAGYAGEEKDAWTEYKANGKVYITSTGLANSGINGEEKVSSTTFTEKKDRPNNHPVFEWDNRSFREYQQWRD